METKTLQEVCGLMIGVAKSCGIEIVKDLDPEEYKQFLVERKAIIEQQKKELQEKKDAKMLRTG